MIVLAVQDKDQGTLTLVGPFDSQSDAERFADLRGMRAYIAYVVDPSLVADELGRPAAFAARHERVSA